jgi:hypothetical protein
MVDDELTMDSGTVKGWQGRGECAQRCPESDAAGNEVEQIKETAAGDNIGKAGDALPVVGRR